MSERDLIDPDMSNQQMRLHFGEMTTQEISTARAAIRFANSRASATIASLSEALAEAEKKGAEDKRRLDWLEVNRNAEISHESFEDDVWQVYTINGGRNDREWTKRSEGETVREAIDAAIRVIPPRNLSQGGQS